MIAPLESVTQPVGVGAAAIGSRRRERFTRSWRRAGDGLGGGLRAFAPAVALATDGREPLVERARLIPLGAAAAELIADKHPNAPSRWSPRAMSLRRVFSATGGRVLGGRPGAAIAVALGAAFAGSRLREKVHGRGRQLAAACAEDVLS